MTEIDTTRPVYLAMDHNHGGGNADIDAFETLTKTIQNAGFTIAKRMHGPNSCGQLWINMYENNVRGATLVFFVNGIDSAVLRTGFKNKKWDNMAYTVRNRDNDFCLIGFKGCCDWVHETGKCYTHIKDMHNDYPGKGAIANEMFNPMQEAIAGEVKCACVSSDNTGEQAAQEFIKLYEKTDAPTNLVVEDNTATSSKTSQEEVIIISPGVIVPRYRKMFTVTTDQNGVISKQINLPYRCKYHVSLFYPGSVEYAHSSAHIELVNNNGEYYIPTQAEIDEYIQRHTTQKDTTIEIINEIPTTTTTPIAKNDPWTVDIPLLATGVPNTAAMADNYVLANEDETYTINYGQAKEVMMQDAKCIQLFGSVSKYVAFPTNDKPETYNIIRREKWNIIEREINKFLVQKKGANVADTQTFTVDLTGKEGNYVNIRDKQDTGYTCGPTSLSACSQAIHMYVSEQTLQNTIHATSSQGSAPSDIKKGAVKYYMKADIVSTSGWSNKEAHLSKGLPVVYHVYGHYIAVIDISDDKSKVLVSNSSGGASGGSHGIKTGWNSVSTLTGKAYGQALLVSPNYTISDSGKTALQHYWNNMGGAWKRTQNLNEAIPVL